MIYSAAHNRLQEGSREIATTSANKLIGMPWNETLDLSTSSSAYENGIIRICLRRQGLAPLTRNWQLEGRRVHLSCLAEKAHMIARWPHPASGFASPWGCKDATRAQLRSLPSGQRDIDNATFEEKREVIVKLGIRVYLSEDLKSVKMWYQCGMGQRLSLR